MNDLSPEELEALLHTQRLEELLRRSEEKRSQ